MTIIEWGGVPLVVLIFFGVMTFADQVDTWKINQRIKRLSRPEDAQRREHHGDLEYDVRTSLDYMNDLMDAIRTLVETAGEKADAITSEVVIQEARRNAWMVAGKAAEYTRELETQS